MPRRGSHLSIFFFPLLLLVHASAAYGASTPASPSDPPAGSPSASVYEVPLEKGRADAAPGGNGGTAFAEGASNGGEEPSLYRSENHFGASSQVPGLPGSDDDPGSGGAAGTGGAGAGGKGGGGPAGTSGAAAGPIADAGNTSTLANVGLLTVIGGVAVGVGLLGFRGEQLRLRP